MKEVSDLIYSYFSNEVTFTNVVADRLYPVIAEKNAELPLAIYTITNKQTVTKDVSEFSVDLSLYFEDNQYTTCVTFADAVEQLVKDNVRFTYQNASVAFVSEDQSIVATITFNIDN